MARRWPDRWNGLRDGRMEAVCLRALAAAAAGQAVAVATNRQAMPRSVG